MEGLLSSILFDENTDKKILRISDDTFSDVMLDKIITDKKNLTYLSCYCTYNDIKFRHEIFDELLNGSLYDSFKTLDNMLSALYQSYDAFELAKYRYERILCAYNVCEQYCNVYNYIINISSDSFFIARLKDCLECMHEDVRRVENSLEECREICKRTKQFKLYISDVWCNAYSFCEDELSCRRGKFTECSKSLGWGDTELYHKIFAVSAEIASCINSLYENELRQMEIFCDKFVKLLNKNIINCRFEIRFYLAICNIVRTLQKRGIPFCLPSINNSKRFVVRDAYDIMLTYLKDIKAVPNDVEFSRNNGLFFLTGANGGGKTTYLCTACINLIFGIAGCPVFGTFAEIYPFNRVYTHFPKTERTDTGRYMEEIERVDKIIANLTSDDFIFFNETFSGTNMQKGTEMALNVAQKIKEKNAYMLFVTHFHGVANSDFPLLTTEDCENNNAAQRTYKIVRSKTVKSSYAHDILKKYGLSREALEERFGDIF